MHFFRPFSSAHGDCKSTSQSHRKLSPPPIHHPCKPSCHEWKLCCLHCKLHRLMSFFQDRDDDDDDDRSEIAKFFFFVLNIIILQDSNYPYNIC